MIFFKVNLNELTQYYQDHSNYILMCDSDSGEGGYLFFQPPQSSQYTIESVSQLFQKEPVSVIDIYNVCNQTQHTVQLRPVDGHRWFHSKYPNQLWIDNQETNLYLDQNPGQYIYLIEYNQSLLICCEDGSEKVYFEMRQKQEKKTVSVLPENRDEDIIGYHQTVVYSWESIQLK